MNERWMISFVIWFGYQHPFKLLHFQFTYLCLMMHFNFSNCEIFEIMLVKISHLHVMLTLKVVQKITSAWDDDVKHVILGKVTYACKS